MPILYKVITSVLAVTGCVSLLITGQMNLLMTISGFAVIPGYYRYFRGRPHAPGWAVGTLSLVTLLVFAFDSALMTGDVFIAVGHLTIAFQAIKSFDLKEPWDHLQVYFMSLLQLIMASELTRSLAFGVTFILFMILLVTAMVLSHFLKEGTLGKVSIKMPVILISSLTLIATAVLFVSIPRTTQKFLAAGHTKRIKTAGFSDRVDFGSFGDVKLDPTVVMRVETDRKISPPYYWRGMTLNYFDGLTWRNTMQDRHRIQKDGDEFLISAHDRSSAVGQKIFLEPLDSTVVFGLAEINAIKADAFALSSDNAMNIYLPERSGARTSYTVYSIVSDSYNGKRDSRYLQLPEGMDKITGLAKSIASGPKTELQESAAIEQYLKKNFTYSLSTFKPLKGINPVEDFLFNTRRGYCEHYATSMVIMLRGLGIPSRIVTGFYGGENNAYGGYIIIRQSDAHSWVEAMVNGKWKRFDPTPSVSSQRPSTLLLMLDSLKLSWTRYVVGFSHEDQRELVSGLSLPFYLSGRLFSSIGQIKLSANIILITFVSVIILFSVYYILGKKRFQKHEFATEKYILLRKALKNKGITINNSTTAGDILNFAGDTGTLEETGEFLRLYEEYRFGRKEMNTDRKERYIGLLKELKKALRKYDEKRKVIK